ncbi:MAG: hypothetical protein PHV74_06480 [Dehalococcoidia bacterium]|nr:hypothetical protein [Dehalococcoidia bacterium]
MSDGFMKSALDRALERADKIEVSQEKLNEMKHRSEGERIASEFLKDLKYSLADELDKFDAEARKYVSKAVEAILLQNLVLPKKETDAARNEAVFHGLSSLKKDANGLKQAKDQLANLSNYYGQTAKQNFEQLKSNFERAMAQAIQQKTGKRPTGKLNVESTPEFQENWRQVSGKLDAEYGKALAQLKQQIAAMS